MSSDNEIELAIGTQGSEGRSEPVGQQIQGDSPSRTMSTMQGMTLGAYISGYGLTAMEVKTGALKRMPRRERKTVQPRKLARVALRASRHQSTLRK